MPQPKWVVRKYMRRAAETYVQRVEDPEVRARALQALYEILRFTPWEIEMLEQC